MADDLTPEEYLARLNEEAARIAAEPPAPPDPPELLQPGQRLRDVLSEQEIEGLRALTRRTGGEEGVRALDAELDIPWDPDISDRLIEEQVLAEQALLHPVAPRRTGRAILIAIVVAVVGMGVVIGGAVLVGSITEEEGPARSLAEASGPARDRGEEAMAVAEQLSVPDSWRPRGEPEISMSGDDESSYAFYDLGWDVPRSTDVEAFRDWFSALPLVQDRRADATCETTLDEEEASCELDLYEVEADGGRDYDAPSQTLTVTFGAVRPGSVGPDRHGVVLAEVYATS